MPGDIDFQVLTTKNAYSECNRLKTAIASCNEKDGKLIVTFKGFADRISEEDLEKICQELKKVRHEIRLRLVHSSQANFSETLKFYLKIFSKLGSVNQPRVTQLAFQNFRDISLCNQFIDTLKKLPKCSHEPVLSWNNMADESVDIIHAWPKLPFGFRALQIQPPRHVTPKAAQDIASALNITKNINLVVYDHPWLYQQLTTTSRVRIYSTLADLPKKHALIAGYSGADWIPQHHSVSKTHKNNQPHRNKSSASSSSSSSRNDAKDSDNRREGRRRRRSSDRNSDSRSRSHSPRKKDFAESSSRRSYRSRSRDRDRDMDRDKSRDVIPKQLIETATPPPSSKSDAKEKALQQHQVAGVSSSSAASAAPPAPPATAAPAAMAATSANQNGTSAKEACQASLDTTRPAPIVIPPAEVGDDVDVEDAFDSVYAHMLTEAKAAAAASSAAAAAASAAPPTPVSPPAKQGASNKHTSASPYLAQSKFWKGVTLPSSPQELLTHAVAFQRPGCSRS